MAGHVGGAQIRIMRIMRALLNTADKESEAGLGLHSLEKAGGVTAFKYTTSCCKNDRSRLFPVR